MQSVEHRIFNGAGWDLSVFQTWDEARLDRARRPVIIVPGYGMNSFIFSYHPSGASLEGYLAQAGFEVWRADLRNQGASRSVGGSDRYGLEDLALTDLGAVVDAVLERTRSAADRADMLGASLGGTIMFIHAVLERRHRLGSLVAIGSPVRWVSIHPLIKAAFSSPTLAGMVRFRGTRRLAEIALPQLVRLTPWLLSIYMNPRITDTSAAREMVKTVEDPNRAINREIAHWIRERDLVLRETNISEALCTVTRPLLCVCANGDGIVPRETAAFPFHQIGSARKSLLEVGTRDIAMAHADLFVSRECHERVFAPVAAWLGEGQP
ncbi:MAG: alpha/beta fold hydrolase [Polyangiaceae bacterium]|nr:alpha/beta fold hydrolase [Polyangiaceae bacterium]